MSARDPEGNFLEAKAAAFFEVARFFESGSCQFEGACCKRKRVSNVQSVGHFSNDQISNYRWHWCQNFRPVGRFEVGRFFATVPR